MLSQRFKQLTPYVPGEQPTEREYLKLNTNENPWPPSPAIESFLKSFNAEALRLYPDPACKRLREALANKYQLQPENVFVGNGSDEVLAFAFYAFFDSLHGPLLFPEFTYSFYPVYCRLYDIDYQRVPLRDDFSLDTDEFIARADSACGMIFPNPNAPTGILLPLEALSQLLSQFPDDKLVLVDEAYIDFGGDSAIALLDRYPNLLVVQTCSKSLALAGLRLGYAFGSPIAIEALNTVKDSFNSYPVSVLGQKIGELAINDCNYYEHICQDIIVERDRFADNLRQLGWQVLPSAANFVFTRHPEIGGRQIYLNLKAQGILVRHFDTDGIRNFVRVTIGKPEDMQRLLDALKKLI